MRGAVALEWRVVASVALGGLPGLLLAAHFAWRNGDGARIGVGFAVLIWGVASFIAWRQVQRPVSSLRAVVKGLKDGDFSIAPRDVGAGALGALQAELDGLAGLLRTQRLDAAEAAALTRAIFTQMDVAVLAFDEARRLSLLNPAAAKALGLNEATDVGRSALELGFAALLEGPSPRTVSLDDDTSPRDAVRRSRHWELRVTSIRSGGRPQSLVLLTDVQRALRDEEWSSWQRLVRVLSHEINNSLAPIGSIASTLKDELGASPSALGADFSAGLSVIVRRVEGLSRFLQGYSQLARLPAPSRAALELEPLLQRAISLEPRVPVTLEPGPAVLLEADADQLEQLLINLLRNAADASLEVNGRGVRVRWSTSLESVHIEIEDDGPGLSNAENLFVPFFTTKATGSGIGLVLCRQIAESHAGTLHLQSRTGTPGAVASVCLPLRRSLP